MSRSLDLELLAGGEGLDRRITIPHTQKTGLALSGFDAYLREGRVLVFGESEIRYLEGLEQPARIDVLKRILAYPLPCVLVTDGLEPPTEVMVEADRAHVPLLRTRTATPDAMSRLSAVLDTYLSARGVIHGVLLDILGLGVLVVGESGIGKSECALDLVVRGHRLVADDAVELRCRAQSFVFGSCPELTRHHMEIRGLGHHQRPGPVRHRLDPRPRSGSSSWCSWNAGRRVASTIGSGVDDTFYELLGHPDPAGADAGGAGPQRRHPGRGRGAQPAAARERAPRRAAAGRARQPRALRRTAQPSRRRRAIEGRSTGEDSEMRRRSGTPRGARPGPRSRHASSS